MRKNRSNSNREQLLNYLDSNEMAAMIDWINDQPDLDQPDILRELKGLLIEQHEKTGEKDWLEIAEILECNIDSYEESILDEKLHKQMFLLEFDKIDFDLEKWTMFLTFIRENVINIIISDSENNKEIWKLAEKVIKAEKDSGLYDPNNWSAIY